MPPPLPAALGVCTLAGMALILRDISSKMKGENRTWSGLLSQYLAVKGMGWLGRRQRKKLEADTLNVKQVQEETLLKRLHKNANTCYGRQYDFNSIQGKVIVLTVYKWCLQDNKLHALLYLWHTDVSSEWLWCNEGLYWGRESTAQTRQNVFDKAPNTTCYFLHIIYIHLKVTFSYFLFKKN